MKSKAFSQFIILFFLLLTGILSNCVQAQKQEENKALDEKVKKFLDSHENQWHDWNVPASDGKLLYDIIIKNNYKSALEIGTSTGHSAIWIAWALSKTGGKLITIEINEGRYREALDNFKEAGFFHSLNPQCRQYILPLASFQHFQLPSFLQFGQNADMTAPQSMHLYTEK